LGAIPEHPEGRLPFTESSVELLRRAKNGDRLALDRLCRRYREPLRRWAHGRLPTARRDLAETDDLVQETIVRAIDNLEGFEYRRDGALLAYLRTAVNNRVRQEIRRAGRRPDHVTLDVEPRDAGGSPLDQLIVREEIERYDRALASLRESDREAIVARIELALPYDQVAHLLDKPTLSAARTAVSRAVVRLAKALDDGSS